MGGDNGRMIAVVINRRCPITGIMVGIAKKLGIKKVSYSWKNCWALYKIIAEVIAPIINPGVVMAKVKIIPCHPPITIIILTQPMLIGIITITATVTITANVV